MGHAQGRHQCTRTAVMSAFLVLICALLALLGSEAVPQEVLSKDFEKKVRSHGDSKVWLVGFHDFLSNNLEFWVDIFELSVITTIIDNSV